MWDYSFDTTTISAGLAFCQDQRRMEQQAQQHMESAVQTATAAIRNNRTCSDLFNNDVDTVLGVLNGYHNGTSTYGRIEYQDLGGVRQTPNGPQVDAARVVPSFSYGTLPDGTRVNQGIGSANVVINVNSASPWMTGYRDVYDLGLGTQTQHTYRAITLIHELGHVFDLLAPQLGGSRIVTPDGGTHNSQANSAHVAAACFKFPE